MSLTLPSELAWVLNMLGFMWPEADEDKLRTSAQAWRDFGAELVRVNQNARLVAVQVSTENSADSIDSFDRFWHGVGGRGGDFDRAKEAADHMATALDLTAGLVEGVKVAIIAQLGLLAAEIIVDQVAAPVTLGLSEGAMVGEVILTRVIVRRIIQEGIHKVGHEIVHSLKARVLDLFRRILATAVRRALVGATVAGGMDVAKQEADVHIFHSRTQLDLTEVGLATGTGAVLGVASAPGARKRPRPLQRVKVSEKATWNPSDHVLGANGLPAHGDGHTFGRLEVDGQTYYVKNGMGEPGQLAWNDPDIRAGAVTPTHAEGHATQIVRMTGAKEATLEINNPGGPCRFCKNVIENILPEGSRLTVVWPDGEHTYLGNAK